MSTETEEKWRQRRKQTQEVHMDIQSHLYTQKFHKNTKPEAIVTPLKNFNY